MSKKRDRSNINYRYCPSCGTKRIVVYTLKYRIRKKECLECTACNKKFVMNSKGEK